MLSVIMPFYNAKKYIEVAIESVLTQTFQDLELVLVDDGSNDGSELIAENYAKTDDRIKLIHQKNQGVSVARNVGLDNASGEYLTFVDSDDCINLEAYSFLMEFMLKNDADIIQFSFKDVDDTYVDSSKPVFEPVVKFGNKAIMLDLFGNMHDKDVYAASVLWSKIYRRDMFAGISFPVGKVFEDAMVLHHIYSKTDKIYRTKSVLYFYKNNPNSICRKPYNLDNLNKNESFYDRYIFFKKYGDRDLIKKSYNQLLYSMICDYKIVKEKYPEEKVIIHKLESGVRYLYKTEYRSLTLKSLVRLIQFLLLNRR